MWMKKVLIIQPSCFINLRWLNASQVQTLRASLVRSKRAPGEILVLTASEVKKRIISSACKSGWTDIVTRYWGKILSGVYDLSPMLCLTKYRVLCTFIALYVIASRSICISHSRKLILEDGWLASTIGSRFITPTQVNINLHDSILSTYKSL